VYFRLYLYFHLYSGPWVQATGPLNVRTTCLFCTNKKPAVLTLNTDFKIHFKLSTVRVLAFVLVLVLSLVLGPVSTGYRSAKCTDDLLVLHKQETGSTDTKYWLENHFKLSTVRVCTCTCTRVMSTGYRSGYLLVPYSRLVADGVTDSQQIHARLSRSRVQPTVQRSSHLRRKYHPRRSRRREISK